MQAAMSLSVEIICTATGFMSHCSVAEFARPGNSNKQLIKIMSSKKSQSTIMAVSPDVLFQRCLSAESWSHTRDIVTIATAESSQVL